MREDWQANRAEGQRLRIIRILEDRHDPDATEQCRQCGKWFSPKGIGSHETACDGSR